MIKKHKNLLLCTIIVLLLISVTSTAFGFQENGDNFPIVIFEKELIEDKDELFERARNKVSDVVNNNNIVSQGFLKEKNSETKIPLKVYTTTQLYRIEKLPGGGINTYYATTNLIEIQSSGGSRDAWKWDETGGVKAYNTIYYSLKGNKKYAHFLKGEGGWINYDYPQVSLANRQVKHGKFGIKEDGGLIDEIRRYKPTSNYSYNTPSHWTYIEAHPLHYFGETTLVDIIATDGSQWELILDNDAGSTFSGDQWAL
ncbi:hypothetical protein [Desulfitibacter alkalitolerans]|uniref:hypothetical protein n=1 Tax=Desulfitibacter alkalitolerans TaxID=264641 RepID=UPI0004822BD7|nr:hypothetical protein [Desulfitibacter alkalitolerans]